MHTGNTKFYFLIAFIDPVYPCAYREHCIKNYFNLNSRGLSLCIQGTPILHTFTWWLRRFIPVHTGNTPMPTPLLLAAPVYPCAYREHIDNGKFSWYEVGLSLCIQGTRNSLIDETPPKRFIPVHTGNTSPTGISFNPSGGLSLCIQGTPTGNPLRCLILRFIPVHTGNTIIRNDASATRSVYPCAYREHTNYNILFYN